MNTLRSKFTRTVRDTALLLILTLCVSMALKCEKKMPGAKVETKKYYRLKQIDRDGNINYSKVITNGK